MLEIKTARAIECLQKKKLAQEPFLYMAHYFDVSDLRVHEVMASIILWLEDHEILTDAYYQKLLAEKFYTNAANTFIEAFNEYDKNLKDHYSAQDFFNWVIDKYPASAHEFALELKELVKNGLKEHTATVVKRLSSSKNFVMALVELKNQRLDSKANIQLVEDSSIPYQLAKGIICSYQNRMTAKHHALILKSKFPAVLARGFEKLTYDLNAEICDFLCEHAHDAYDLASIFLDCSNAGIPSPIIFLILKQPLRLARGLMEMFSIFPQELCTVGYFTFLTNSLGAYMEDCNKRSMAHGDWVRIAKKMATEFCELMKLFSSEQFFVLVKNCSHEQKIHFAFVVEKFLFFNEKGLLNSANKQQGFVFLFDLLPGFHKLAWDSLVSKNIFNGALGQENFDLIITVSTERLDFLFGTLVKVLETLRKVGLMADKDQSSKNGNKLLKLLITPGLFENTVADIISIRTQQDFDTLIAKKMSEGQNKLKRKEPAPETNPEQAEPTAKRAKIGLFPAEAPSNVPHQHLSSNKMPGDSNYAP